MRTDVAETDLRLVVDLPSKGLFEGMEFVIRREDAEMVVGRADLAGIRLVAQSVSRRHALIESHNGGWRIKDLNSRHGTFLNKAKIPSDQTTALRAGDELQIGPHVFRVAIGPSDVTIPGKPRPPSREKGPSTLHTLDAPGFASIIPHSELRGLAQHRLDVLIQAAGRFSSARDAAELAQTIAAVVADGTNSPRAVLARAGEQEGELEILALRSDDDQAVSELRLSRSLIALAQGGKIAQLVPDDDMAERAVSIRSLNILSAICAPLMVDGVVEAVLYLDARGDERPIEPDSAAFCEAVAKLGAMAMANLRRAELARKERQLRDELKAARIAQQQIMPAPSGHVGPIRYEMTSIPGRIVAGDLFDVVPVDDNRTLVMLGDVMGKGAAAGLMMATVQAYIRASVRPEMDLASLVYHANSFFFQRFDGKGFVTLWIGTFDRQSNQLCYVDAGHGHWCLLHASGEATSIDGDGGPPVGAVSDADYDQGKLDLTGMNRILLYSDGLVEQTNADGEEFGEERVLDALHNSPDASNDVQLLVAALTEYRHTVDLADDLTIASIDPRS